MKHLTLIATTILALISAVYLGGASKADTPAAAPVPAPISLAYTGPGFWGGLWTSVVGSDQVVEGIPVDTIEDIKDEAIEYMEQAMSGHTYNAGFVDGRSPENVYGIIRRNQLLQGADAEGIIDEIKASITHLETGDVIVVTGNVSYSEEAKKAIFNLCQNRDDVVYARRAVRGTKFSLDFMQNSNKEWELLGFSSAE
jgi:hypothetical protein